MKGGPRESLTPFLYWSTSSIINNFLIDSSGKFHCQCLTINLPKGSQCTHESHVNTQLRKTSCDHTTTTADQLEALKDLLLK